MTKRTLPERILLGILTLIWLLIMKPVVRYLMWVILYGVRVHNPKEWEEYKQQHPLW